MPLDPDWLNTIEDGVTNVAWDAHDPILMSEVDSLNTRLPARIPSFSRIDWRLAKAMLWVESGGPSRFNNNTKRFESNPSWSGRVLQIGNAGDPAYGVVKDKKDRVSLVVDEQFNPNVSIETPGNNIKFGLIYLVQKHVSAKWDSVVDPRDSRRYEITAKPGDSLDKIARDVGSTTDLLKRLNPGKDRMLRPGDKVQYQKAALRLVATGWTAVTTATIAERYNGGGDSNYKAKLDHVIEVLGRLRR